jgi:hypothetical protein
MGKRVAAATRKVGVGESPWREGHLTTSLSVLLCRCMHSSLPLHFFFSLRCFFLFHYKMNSISFPVIAGCAILRLRAVRASRRVLKWDGYIVTKIVFIGFNCVTAVLESCIISARSESDYLHVFVLEFHAD